MITHAHTLTVQRDYEARRAAALDAKPHVQAWNNGSRGAVSSVLRSFGTVVFVGAPRRQPGRPLATADGD